MMPFIVLEGCDGSGKTTLREMLRRELDKIGLKTVTVGQHSWLHPWYSRVLISARENRQNMSQQILSDAYLHDKYLHGMRNITPARDRAVVVADRWFYSDAVYHAALYGIPLEQTLKRHCLAGTIVPELLVYVAVEAELAYKRILIRGKHTRHYERPTDLQCILCEYDNLLKSDLVANVKIIKIENSIGLNELQISLKDILIPAIFQTLGEMRA